MKICNEYNFISPELNRKRTLYKKSFNEVNSFEVSSLEALSNIKRADLTISFTGNTLRMPAELTADEYKKYAEEIEEKISKIRNELAKNDLKDCLSDVKRRSDNSIFLLDRVVSKPCLYNNHDFVKKFASWIFADTNLKRKHYSADEVKPMVRVADKILACEGLCKNKALIADMTDILRIANRSSHDTDSIVKIINKISKEELYKNKVFSERIPRIFQIAKNFGVESAKAIIDKKIYDDYEKFSRTESLLGDATTDKTVKAINNIIRNDKFFELELSHFNKFNYMVKSASYNRYTIDVLCELLKHEEFYSNPEFIDAIYDEDSIYAQDEEEMRAKSAVIKKIFSSKEIIKNNEIKELFAKIINEVVLCEESKNVTRVVDIIEKNEKIRSNPEAVYNALFLICETMHIQDSYDKKILDRVYRDAELLLDNRFMEFAPALTSYCCDEESCKEVISLLDDKNIIPFQIFVIIGGVDSVCAKYEDIVKLNQTIGFEKASKLFLDDTLVASKFIDMYQKRDLKELPYYVKKNLLNKLLESNTSLPLLPEDINELFPLIPKSREEYCGLLSKLVKSIGIKTNKLDNAQTYEFYSSIFNLSDKLSKLSDKEFNDLKITQKYSKDDFILDVLLKTYNLPSDEVQDIFNYFQFNLTPDDRAKTGYSIVGYPILNDEKTDEKLKSLTGRIRDNVNEFLNNNPVECNNKEIETELNKIISALPELRPLIGKVQSGNVDEIGNKIGFGSHDFDVFKHSLKVMQKIAQNPEFNREKTNSDKKILLLASLLHDITKKEGYGDSLHPERGSFDAYYISKKFKLTFDEEYKLYTLIKTHEWLAKVNSSKDKYDLEKNLQSAAYDLRHDNLLDLSLIFTHADLMAVKKDNSFHNKDSGKGRTNFDGVTRSFGKSAEVFGNEMKQLISGLKETQPILPVTKFPSASRINEAITRVNKDGSTNLKGIYKDSDGLIIVKYNEVRNETWEKIGFPQGSASRGIKLTTPAHEQVNTGNIKFFVHGLERDDQLANFDVFSLVDSDALLSVSYAERPESKYRFFRPQGIILNCPTKFIHGGGDTDAGSGMKKSIQTFKDNYLYNGRRHSDRCYISDLIKKRTGMTSKEYVSFIKENENKSFSEIKPKELRDNIIKAFASINSNIRHGNREYNEMYITNPYPPMAVYAYNYSNKENTGNPVQFLNRTSRTVYEKSSGAEYPVWERTYFLREYALRHDIPFFVFGD